MGGCMSQAKQSKTSRKLKIECKICFIEFDMVTYIPMVLSPCSHTICKVCLDSLPQKKCPMDNTPIKSSGKNFSLVEIIQAKQSKLIVKDNPVAKAQSTQTKPIIKPIVKPQTPQKKIAVEIRPIAAVYRTNQPIRQFSPKKQPLLGNRIYQQCEKLHQMKWSSTLQVCSKCNKPTGCWGCSKCNQYSCLSCSNYNHQKHLCPNKDPLRWSNQRQTCSKCAELNRGYQCLKCNYCYCDKCAKTEFASTSCPLFERTQWTGTTRQCSKCDTYGPGWYCQKCSYHKCDKCSNQIYGRLCPNLHQTILNKAMTSCIKCKSMKGCYRCDLCTYRICEECSKVRI